MQIRRYDARDHDDVLAVWFAASKVGHPFLSEDDLIAQLKIVGEIYLPGSETWVAEEDGSIVAFIGLLDSFIGGLFVAPEGHGRGIGRRLVEHAFSLKGPLTVDVYARNPMAPAFYRRCGFVEIGRKDRDDEGRPFELIVMRKDR
ncbi:MAG TPA: GNAT family N-acetyltransferase [Alphaproteobacteria bacterium]|nr:GNAT family N-acetyltransferase [Alphaproteobacteria bacterium]